MSISTHIYHLPLYFSSLIFMVLSSLPHTWDMSVRSMEHLAGEEQLFHSLDTYNRRLAQARVRQAFCLVRLPFSTTFRADMSSGTVVACYNFPTIGETMDTVCRTGIDFLSLCQHHVLLFQILLAFLITFHLSSLLLPILSPAYLRAPVAHLYLHLAEVTPAVA